MVEITLADSSSKLDAQKVPDADDNVEELTQQLASQSLALTKPRMFKATFFWDRIVSDNLEMDDNYVFGYPGISAYKMTHVLKAYTQYRKRTKGAYFDQGEQAQVISELCTMLDSAQLLEDNELPGISFFDPHIMLHCPNQKSLVKSAELLGRKHTL
ncbi:uncharacterized protein MEPE_04122 [Melanopsichium pennsylvanicum]|uniref:Uncharacterized protein n=2 Tax=Melanopsichium pennsylvanicum TaxID=63383 RepID=A0AAJ4XNK1_9BASI|nr:uncharacterized protein BN887_02916 [Melanopsichium pennsylvanicum 4]SNX85413.1 uncharacterized protein MEPE_04122 [Melanopsichium pennsylvanicum]